MNLISSKLYFPYICERKLNMENTKFYIKKSNNFEELETNKLFSKEYFYYYNIFISIKMEFVKVKQVLPRYIVFDETLMPTRLLVYVYRDELTPDDIVDYPLNYLSIKEGLDQQAKANERDNFSIKFHLL